MVRLVLLTALLALSAAAAPADPCEAVRDHGPRPSWLSRGSVFAGPVAYVGDGDSLCVAVGEAPRDWVEVRLQDFYAPELHEPGGLAARAALVGIAYRRGVRCVAAKRSYDRIVARCTLGGVSLGDRTRTR